jgi:hypothetical protein
MAAAEFDLRIVAHCREPVEKELVVERCEDLLINKGGSQTPFNFGVNIAIELIEEHSKGPTPQTGVTALECSLGE